MTAAKTITGANILCYIDGRLYSRASSVSWNSATPHKPIMALDSVDPYELAVTTTHVTASMSVYRLHGDGGAQGAGMVPNYEDLPRGRYFTLILVDRMTNNTLFRMKNCVVNGESWSVPSRGIVTGSLSLEGITWDNEA